MTATLFRIGRSRVMTATLAGLLTMGIASAQPAYTLTDLGVLPGYAASIATGLNERGEVVGYCAPAVENFNQMAFVWSNGTMKAMGKLNRGNYSVASAISSSGVIVGDGDTGNIRPQSWVTFRGSLLNFFPNNGGNTHVSFISDTGWIGGYYTKSLGGWVSSWKAAIWTPDPAKPDRYRPIDLPILPGGIDPKSSAAIPSGFNQGGQAAGYAQTDQIGQHACFWNNDAAHSILDLGVYSDDWSSVANSINDLGQVAGSSHPPFGSRAVVWNNDAARTPVELPLLPGDNYGSATVINNLGQVLGTSAYGIPGTWEIGAAQLVMWRDGQVYPLQSLLGAAASDGWVINYASALNHRGQIVGSATRNGVTRAILLTPVP